MISLPADQPIGVFDSGIGGLSVLRALLGELPHERFVYFADNAHAPYGERGDAHVQTRAQAVAHELIERHHVKALVVACNTATTAAVHALRGRYREMPIVGIEPALKPAADGTRTGHVGVLATRGTLVSAKFAALAHSLSEKAQFHLHACDGLADAIEHDAALGNDEATRRLIDQHLNALNAQRALGCGPGEIDTVVLGCTHYPLAWPLWQAHLAERAKLLDPAAAVARQTARVIAQANLLRAPRSADALPTHQANRTARVIWQSSGNPAPLHAAVRQHLPDVQTFE